MDDAKSGRLLAQLMRDPDATVAHAAIRTSGSGGPEVEQALGQILDDPSAPQNLKLEAAEQLRGRGNDLDDATEKKVTALVGAPPAFGGSGYGGDP